MKSWFASVLFAALAVAMSPGLGPICAPQSGQAATQSPTAKSLAAAGKQGVFTVELTKALDAKKVKEGDEVEAKLTGGITLPGGATVPTGAKVIGHVTRAKARTKSDSESALGIVFDKIVLGKGQETPIKGVLQAVAPNPNRDVTTGGGPVDYGVSLRMDTTNNASAPDTRRGPVPILNDESTGVLGFKNMELGPDGVLTSKTKDVKLDSGTRMLLNVTMQ